MKGLAVPRQFFGGAFGGGRPEGRADVGFQVQGFRVEGSGITLTLKGLAFGPKDTIIIRLLGEFDAKG